MLFICAIYSLFLGTISFSQMSTSEAEAYFEMLFISSGLNLQLTASDLHLKLMYT